MKNIKTYLIESNTKSIISDTNLDKYLSLPGMEEEVKKWYHKKYKTDDMWKEIEDSLTFKDALKLLIDDSESWYDHYAGDSLIRERIFNRLKDICKVTYSDIYNLWS